MCKSRRAFAVSLGLLGMSSCSGANLSDLVLPGEADSGAMGSSSGTVSGSEGGDSSGSGGGGSSGGSGGGSSGSSNGSDSSGGMDSSGGSDGSPKAIEDGGDGAGGEGDAAAGEGGKGGPIPVECGAMACTLAKPFCCETKVTVDATSKAQELSRTCVETQAACTGETAIRQCNRGKNCQNGQVCCRLASGGVTSQLCELSCATGEDQLCSTAVECATGDRCLVDTAGGDAATATIGVCTATTDSGPRDH